MMWVSVIFGGLRGIAFGVTRESDCGSGERGLCQRRLRVWVDSRCRDLISAELQEVGYWCMTYDCSWSIGLGFVSAWVGLVWGG